MSVIAIANQKGGTAKTTTTAALGLLFARAGRRVHLIDMDPQASLTHAFGQSVREGTLFGAIDGGGELPVVDVAPGLTLSPSDITLSRGETELLGRPGREHALRRSLAKTALSSDALTLIDCPPSLGILAVNCLTAAQQLVIVIQPGGFELQALVHLEQTVALLRDWVNPVLAVAGAVLTNCHPRRRITEQVAREVSRCYPLLGRIRADAQLLYATSGGTLTGLKHSRALDDYDQVRRNLEQRMEWPSNQSAESPVSWAG